MFGVCLLSFSIFAFDKSNTPTMQIPRLRSQLPWTSQMLPTVAFCKYLRVFLKSNYSFNFIVILTIQFQYSCMGLYPYNPSIYHQFEISSCIDTQNRVNNLWKKKNYLMIMTIDEFKTYLIIYLTLDIETQRDVIILLNY